MIEPQIDYRQGARYLGECRGCGRGMKSSHAKRLGTHVEGATVAHGARGLCLGCYSRWKKYGTTKPIRTPKPVGDCRQCGKSMRSSYAHDHDIEIPGTEATHGARGLCRPCLARAIRTGEITPQRESIPAEEVLEEWVMLRGQGLTERQAAPRIGMTYEALYRALYRARCRGDERGNTLTATVKSTQQRRAA